MHRGVATRDGGHREDATYAALDLVERERERMERVRRSRYFSRVDSRVKVGEHMVVVYREIWIGWVNSE